MITPKLPSTTLTLDNPYVPHILTHHKWMMLLSAWNQSAKVKMNPPVENKYPKIASYPAQQVLGTKNSPYRI